MKKNLFIFGLSMILVACGSTKSITTATQPAKVITAEPVVQEAKKSVENNATVAISTVATVAEAADFEDKISVDSGKAMYANNCARCHKLFEPKDFSKDQWGPILVSMQKKAKLSDAEMAPISNYIYSQL